ncbi:MAG: hypothetical protein WBK55_09180 [Alphaproteobacteria bacterium]
MIRAVLCLSLLIICLAPQPAGAEGFWIFGKKKQESAAAAQKQKIFNAPAVKETGKKSFISKLFGIDQKKAAPDVKINGVTFKGLRPEMLASSYIPKTTDEIMLLSFVHKSWEGDAMVRRQALASQRAAASLQKSDEALKKMQAEATQQMTNASTGVATPKGVRPASAGPGTSAEKQIFNKPVLKTPAKVFKDYR